MVVPAPESLPIPVGAIIAEKYRVDRFLGAGGMGIVALGRHLGLDHKIAIKMLHPQMALDHEAVARFIREARAVTRIQSEHVVKVIDVGSIDNRIPFIVMEYLEGSDLAKQVRERGRLEINETIEYVLQACEALAEAHRNGIVHRDIKPANIFVARRADGSPLVKVLDFGVSKLQAAQNLSVSEELTRSNVLIGSPHYMSPEQLRSPKDVDARSDIWALGAMFYKLLTGKPAFAGTTMADLHAAVLTRTAPRLSAERPDAPPELDAVVAKCLEKNLEQRFASVAELAEALAPIATEDARSSIRTILRVTSAPREKPSSIPPPPQQSVPSARLSSSSSSSSSGVASPAVGDDGSVSVHMTLSGARPRESSARAKWLALYAAGLTAIVVAVVLFTQRSRETPASAIALPKVSAEAPSLPDPPVTVTATPSAAPIASAAPPASEESAENKPTSAKPSHVAPHASAAHAHVSPQSTATTAAPAPSATAKPSGDGLSEFGGRT